MNKNSMNETINHEKCKDDSIIALKIQDQCRFEECVTLGPIVSDEHCECIILADEDSRNDFGRIILPGRPIYVPETVCKVKLLSDSFKIENITILDITKSHLDHTDWDVQIKFEFTFKLQLLEFNMRPLKILCCEKCEKNSKRHETIKNFIRGSACFIKQVRLHGEESASSFMTSDLFTPMQTIHSNTPHALVEANAFPLDVQLKCPKDACHFEDVFDDIYDEPIIYIFITIGLNAIVQLFRLQSMRIDAKDIAIPKHCCDIEDDPCAIFSDMEFPKDQFFPKSNP